MLNAQYLESSTRLGTIVMYWNGLTFSRRLQDTVPVAYYQHS